MKENDEDEDENVVEMTILDTMINMTPWLATLFLLRKEYRNLILILIGSRFIFMCFAMLCVLMYSYAVVGTEAVLVI